ncbi:MAG: hypothetical protein ACOCUR_00390 [Nanoarchaeota archaeon]
MISKKSQAITRVIAFLLAFTVVVVVFISIMGPDGKVHVTDDKVTEMQDKLIEVNREWRGITRDQINADSGLVAVWESLVDDILIAKERTENPDEYCIIPFKRSLYTKDVSVTDGQGGTGGTATVSAFDSKNNIKLLESDDDLLVMLSFTEDDTDHVPQIKMVSIPDVELYYGLPLENSGTSFPSIRKRTAESIETRQIARIGNEDYSLGDGSSSFSESSYQDNLRFYQPLFSERDNFKSLISTDEVLERATLNHILSYDSIILANADEVIIVLNTPENIEDPSLFNILDEFSDASGLDTGQNGFPFCNPEYNAQLAPKSGNKEDCQCEHAENQAMCNSLTEDNCANNCFWSGTECLVDRDAIRPFFDALGGKFAEIAVDAEEGKDCWDYYTLDADIVPENNLDHIIEDAYLFSQSVSRGVYSLAIRSTKHNIMSDLFPSQTRASDITFGTKNHPIYFSGSNNENDLVIKPEERDNERNRKIELVNDKYYFYTEFSSDPNKITLYSSREFVSNYDNFCDPDAAYRLGIINTCDDARTRETCFYHGQRDSDGCYWNDDDEFCTRVGAFTRDGNDYVNVDILVVPISDQANSDDIGYNEDLFDHIQLIKHSVRETDCIPENLLSEELNVGDDVSFSFGLDEYGGLDYVYIYFEEIHRIFGAETGRTKLVYPFLVDEDLEIC